jgi:hypothetical protein
MAHVCFKSFCKNRISLGRESDPNSVILICVNCDKNIYRSSRGKKIGILYSLTLVIFLFLVFFIPFIKRVDFTILSGNFQMEHSATSSQGWLLLFEQDLYSHLDSVDTSEYTILQNAKIKSLISRIEARKGDGEPISISSSDRKNLQIKLDTIKSFNQSY